MCVNFTLKISPNNFKPIYLHINIYIYNMLNHNSLLDVVATPSEVKLKTKKLTALILASILVEY